MTQRRDEWEGRWRDQTDEDIATLQRDYISAAQAMIEVREWIKNHDNRHDDDRQTRQSVPGTVRDWILFGLTILTILLALGVIKPGG